MDDFQLSSDQDDRIFGKPLRSLAYADEYFAVHLQDGTALLFIAECEGYDGDHYICFRELKAKEVEDLHIVTKKTLGLITPAQYDFLLKQALDKARQAAAEAKANKEAEERALLASLKAKYENA